jgi:peptidyl-prolyl cis-trans isomerase D
MKKPALVLMAALLSVVGCDSLRSAMTAHTDVAARAGSQELSTQKLADLIGNSTVPLSPEKEPNEKMARAVADVWINYQLLGKAAAQNDTFTDPKEMDRVLWREINQVKIEKLYNVVSQDWKSTDTVATEADYNQGFVLSAAHILFAFPQPGGPQAVDSVKKVAESVRKNLTGANFSEMVARHSKDSASLPNKGLYPAFPKGMMVKEFEDALMALRPGEISAPVQTRFGYHIIRRPMFEEVKAEIGKAKAERQTKLAESTYVAKLQEDGDVDVKKNAPEVARKVANDIDANRKNGTVLATSKVGKFTAGDFARVLRSFPNRQQIAQSVQTMPDTLIPVVVTELVRQDLLVRMADSAKLGPDSAELSAIRARLTNHLVGAWRQLGVEPESLGDSAANEAARMRVAAARVDSFMVGLMQSQRMYVTVADPLETLLREQNSFSISDAGISRALEQATRVRALADSARALEMRNAPPTDVPMPGAQPPAGGKEPPPATGRGGGSPPPSGPGG